VEFEPTIPAFEREKTVHALDRVATLIGGIVMTRWKSQRNSEKDVLQCDFVLQESHVKSTRHVPEGQWRGASVQGRQHGVCFSRYTVNSRKINYDCRHPTSIQTEQLALVFPPINNLVSLYKSSTF
jgi:hypothetical protein